MTRSLMIWIRASAVAVFLVPVLWTLSRELIQERPFGEPTEWLGVVLPLCFAFLLPVVWALTGRAHHEWQFRDAPLAPASLVSAAATGTSGSGTEQFRLRMEVFPQETSPFETTMVEFINLGELPLLVPGAELEVLHLPGERAKLRRVLLPARPRDQHFAPDGKASLSGKEPA